MPQRASPRVSLGMAPNQAKPWDAAIAVLQEQVDTQKERIETLETTKTTQAERIETLETKVKTLQTKSKRFQTNLRSLLRARGANCALHVLSFFDDSLPWSGTKLRTAVSFAKKFEKGGYKTFFTKTMGLSTAECKKLWADYDKLRKGRPADGTALAKEVKECINQFRLATTKMKLTDEEKLIINVLGNYDMFSSSGLGYFKK